MKSITKFAAVLLAVLMTIALSVPAFADETTPDYSITVSNTSGNVSIKGNTYYAFKLFDVTYNADGSAYAYTISVDNPFFAVPGAKVVLETYFTLTQSKGDVSVYNVTLKEDDTGATIPFGASEVRAMADALNEFLPDAADADASATASGESVVIEPTEPGYYLVAGLTDAVHAGQIGNAPKVNSAIAITNADPKGEINIKADAPDIDKFIVNADDLEDTDNNLGRGTAVNVGDTVKFALLTAVPTSTVGYSSYTMIVHDYCSDGLTLIVDENHPVTVVIGDTELASNEYTVEKKSDTVLDVTIPNVLVTEEITDKVTGETSTVRKYADGADVTVYCYAVLNDGALTTDVEKNTVYLEYSSNPYDESETKKTPEHTVYVYDFDVVIDKFAGTGDDEKKLSGAKFVLHRVSDSGTIEYAKIDDTTSFVTWYTLTPADTTANVPAQTIKEAVEAGNITEVETDAKGVAKFAGLDTGIYYLTETAAPDGYNLMTSDVEVKIEATYADDGSGLLTSSTATRTSTVVNEGTEDEDVEYGQYEQTVSIENKTGTVLPETGGKGTFFIIAISAIVFVSVMVVLVAKKRLYNEG